MTLRMMTEMPPVMTAKLPATTVLPGFSEYEHIVCRGNNRLTHPHTHRSV